MTQFVKIGTTEINLLSQSIPTQKKDFVKMFKGKVPDVEEAFKVVAKARKELKNK